MGKPSEPFKAIFGYQLTAYKRVPENKRDLTRPYWSYEWYRCIEDAFLIYMQEEERMRNRKAAYVAPSSTAKESGLPLNTIIRLYQTLREREIPILWYFPNMQPAYPIWQDLIQYTQDNPKHPFNKGVRTVLYVGNPPPFYTMKTFRQAFPNEKIYRELNNPETLRLEYYNYRQRIKKERNETSVIADEFKQYPLTEAACTEQVANSDKHPLYDPSDPPENTVSFVIKFFGCRTYEEIEKHNPQFAAGRLYANRHLKV